MIFTTVLKQEFFVMATRRALLALLILLPFTANAQDWPTRPIRVIVPYPPGGSTDIAARLIGESLNRSLGQQTIIENKSGAGGVIGVEAAAHAAPDGYTILVAPDFVTSAPHIFKMNIDPMKTLVPVIQLSRQPVVLAVHPSLGVNTLAEFIALAKRQPGMGFATSGVGSQQHIVAEWFAKLAGIKLQHVPYRGGGQAISDLIAGHIKVASLGSTPLVPHYKAGTVLILAQSTEARSPSLPNVPTYQEAGIKGLVLDQWLGVFVPIGTPPAIVARLNEEIEKALKEKNVRDNLLKSAQEPVGGTAAKFAALVLSDYEKYGKLVKELGIKAEQ
jgi:tripartite-type tricarboxylate transporter receptor subunit TctC